jgi:hypothetical protein
VPPPTSHTHPRRFRTDRSIPRALNLRKLALGEGVKRGGLHFTALDGIDILNTGGTGIAERPNATGITPQLANPSPTDWINKAAFVYNAPYIYGNDGRNNIIGPGIIETDLSLTKTILAKERFGAQLRWEVFNATNHPIFGVPNATLSSAVYGQISSTIIDAREMQLGLRLIF